MPFWRGTGLNHHLLLLRGNLLREFGLPLRLRCSGLPRQPTLVNGEALRLAYNHRPLNDVPQLANIAGPEIGLEQLQASLVDPPDAPTRIPCVAIDEIFDKQGN